MAKEEEFKTSDVGCGSNPTGDVNCDLYRDYTPQSGPQNMLVKVDTRGNFIQCDAEHLPFKSSTFKKVYCSHIIEHVNNPYQLIRELLRVANSTVIIKCPHRLSRGAKMPAHRHYFNITWFKNVLSNYRTKITCSYKGFPFAYFSILRLPDEIKVTIKK